MGKPRPAEPALPPSGAADLVRPRAFLAGCATRREPSRSRNRATGKMVMSTSTERQFQAADDAVEQAVIAFVGEIEQMLGKWEAVAPAYIAQGALLALCAKLSELVDDPIVRDF